MSRLRALREGLRFAWADPVVRTMLLVIATLNVAVIGIGAAYLGVVLVAWRQERVSEQLRGRIMSLVVLAAVALDPLSYALAGALLPAGTTIMFCVCGALILLCAATTAMVPAVRRLT